VAETDDSKAAVGQFVNGEGTAVALFANHEFIQVMAGKLCQGSRAVQALGGGLRSEFDVEEPAFDLVSLPTGHIGLHSSQIVALKRIHCEGGKAQIIYMKWKGMLMKWTRLPTRNHCLSARAKALLGGTGATIRPNFAAPISGAYFPEVPPIPKDVPPFFMELAQDHNLAGPQIMNFYDALKALGYKPELHLYEHGSHSWSMRKQAATSDHWLEEFYWRLEAHGLTESWGAAIAFLEEWSAASNGTPPKLMQVPVLRCFNI
jgi:hypothetical protein